MREFIRVTVSNSIKPLGELAKEVERWDFKYHDPKLDFATNRDLYLLTIGRVRSIEGNSILFETQDYYEKIPLKIANSGTIISLCQNRFDFLADGIIEEKYYTKATKNHFAKEPLDNENSAKVNCKLQFNTLERQAFIYGEVPLSMDGKWFIYTEDNRVHFYRSWTRVEAFNAELVEKSDGVWGFENARIHNDFVNDTDRVFYGDLIMSFVTRRAKLFE